MRNFRLKKISFLLLLVFILLISTIRPVNAYTNGKKTQRTNVETQIQAYHNEWAQAVIYWDQNHQYRNIFGRSGAPNIMTAEYDSSNPGRYGRIIYNSGRKIYSTPFYTYLNSYNTKIRNSSNVRRSTASHEIGHALGLAHEELVMTIMNRNRNREVLTYPTSVDINRVNIIR